MVGKKKKYSLCGYTFNSLEKTDKEFHYTKAYKWYLDLCGEDIAFRHLRTIGLVKVGCMLSVFGVPNLALWCAKCFNASRRKMKVGDNIFSPISLSPLTFQKMLRLLEPNKELKLLEVNDFLTNHDGPKR